MRYERQRIVKHPQDIRRYMYEGRDFVLKGQFYKINQVGIKGKDQLCTKCIATREWSQETLQLRLPLKHPVSVWPILNVVPNGCELAGLLNRIFGYVDGILDGEAISIHDLHICFQQYQTKWLNKVAYFRSRFFLLWEILEDQPNCLKANAESSNSFCNLRKRVIISLQISKVLLAYLNKQNASSFIDKQIFTGLYVTLNKLQFDSLWSFFKLFFCYHLKQATEAICFQIHFRFLHFEDESPVITFCMCFERYWRTSLRNWCVCFHRILRIGF